MLKKILNFFKPYEKVEVTSNLKMGKQYLLVMYDINAVGGTFIHMVVHYNQKKIRGVMKVKYFLVFGSASTIITSPIEHFYRHLFMF